MKAIEVALAISGADKVNVVGWCVGGTILSSALAVLRARGDETVASLTLLTTMLDFRDPGDLGVFIDEQGVSQREQTIGKGGIYPGSGTRLRVPDAARQRPDLALRGQQLPEGQVARRLRPAVLERRRAPTCPGRCTPGTCATCTWRTTCACRTG